MKNFFQLDLKKQMTKLTNIISKMANKEELQNEITILRKYVVNLKEEKDKLTQELNATQNQLRIMSNQYNSIYSELEKRKSEEKATKYSDSSKNY